MVELYRHGIVAEQHFHSLAYGLCTVPVLSLLVASHIQTFWISNNPIPR